MATLRSHVRINCSADQVWAVVTDAGAISTWFSGIDTSTASGATRNCTATDGVAIEEIVTNDPELRRFQYRIVGGGMRRSSPNLGTVDVFEDGSGSIGRRLQHRNHPGQPRRRDGSGDRRRAAGTQGVRRGAVTGDDRCRRETFSRVPGRAAGRGRCRRSG